MVIPNRSAGSPTTRATGEPSWGIPDAVLGWLVAWLFANIVAVVVFGLGGYSGTVEIKGAPLTWTMAASVFIWIDFVIVAVWVAATKGNGWIRDYHVAIRPLDVPLGIAAGVIGQFVLVNAIAWPILKLSGKTADDLARPAQELADKAHGAGGAFLFIFVVVIVAPCAEELFFRGLLFRALEKRLDRWWALGLSSVAFAFTHFQLLQFLPLAAAGAVFGYLVIRTDRLGPAIVAHMVFNLSTAVVLLWMS